MIRAIFIERYLRTEFCGKNRWQKKKAQAWKLAPELIPTFRLANPEG
jgi:hypothetical protein